MTDSTTDRYLPDPDLLRRTADALAQNVSQNWSRLTSSVIVYDGPVFNVSLSADSLTGAQGASVSAPDVYCDRVEDLHAAMAEAGHSWFTMRLQIDADGQFDFDFGYEPVVLPFSDEA